MATASNVYRDYAVDGVPASGKHKPKKSEIRTLLKGYEDIMSALSLADDLQGAWDASTGSFPSGAQEGYSWIASTPGTVGGKFFGEGDQIIALVNGASTSVYAGNWVVIPAWSSGVVPAVDAGAGTANAIQITTEKPVSDDTIVVFTLDTSTTSSPVTVSINGGAALTLKTNRGNDASALTAGQEIWGRIRSSDSTFRLLNDQDVSALVGQAEAALAEFQQSYLGAKASDPATDNEGNPLIEGALYWNSVSGKMRVYHSAAWEDFGGVPDGSITTIKLANDVVILNSADRTALKAIDTTKFKTAYLNEEGREGIFRFVAAELSGFVAADTEEGVYIEADDVDADAGAWVRQHEGRINLRWFGAKGNYNTDDTDAVLAWIDFYAAGPHFPLYAPAGVYKCTNNLVLPEGVMMRGDGSCKIGTFPQHDFHNKTYLRPGYKHLIGGTNFIFSGTPTNEVSGGRADTVDITPMVIYNHFAPCDVEGVSFIQDMDVYDAGGTLTTKTTDNRATGYSHGVFHRGTLSRWEDVTVFGYFFGGRGFIHLNVPGDDGGGGNDPDYPKLLVCYISSGLAVWGADTAQSEGNTGLTAVASNFFGCDHHTRADSDPDIPSLEIDIPLSTSQQGRGHAFTGCSFRTCADEAIKLDHCSDIMFANMTTEFSEVAGVTGLSERGYIIGTSNTGNVTISGVAASGDLKLAELRKAIGGNLSVTGLTNGGGGGIAAIKNLNLVRGLVLAVSSSTITPHASYHLIDTSGGNVSINTISITNMKTNDIVFFRRSSGSGTVTFNTGGNLALGGASSRVLNAASDVIAFLIDGSNAWQILFSDNA